MSTEGYLTEEDFDKNPELLDMSGKEFQFVRHGCHIPQAKAFTKADDTFLSQGVVSLMEQEAKMNPFRVGQFLLGKPAGLIKTLRKQFKDMEEKENAK